MMIAANFQFERRYTLFREAIKMTTLLEALVVIDIEGVTKPLIEHWCGKFLPCAHYLKHQGQAGVVKVKPSNGPKLQKRGVTHMLVGFS